MKLQRGPHSVTVIRAYVCLFFDITQIHVAVWIALQCRYS